VGAKAKSSKVGTVLLSGGIDSAACVAWLVEHDYATSAFFVDYGQLARKQEKQSAQAICKHYGIPFVQCTVKAPREFGIGEIVGRNAFLITAALLCGLPPRGLLVAGIHSGSPYYDCSERFVQLMRIVVADYTQGMVSLFLPFGKWGKMEIVHYAHSVKVPLEKTYSCQRGRPRVCGKCPSCRDRVRLGC
jgi:7-cyano-7-deazaguanine synthase